MKKYRDAAFVENLRKHVYRYMQINNKKVSDLAKSIGVSRTTLYAYLQGTTAPSAKNLKLLAKELGVEIADLFKEN